MCLAVAQALLGYASESHWLRAARRRLGHLFPYLPKQPGYNKRLRAALPLVKRVIRELAMNSDLWFDDIWIVDSTPVPCAMSRPSVQRSELAGFASYEYCASHSRFLWGPRLYLVCTPSGMPILWALANAKLGEREVLAAMLEDKGFGSGPFEKDLAGLGIDLLRPSRKREKRRYGEPMLKKVRQLIESVNDTLKGQLDLEVHGGQSIERAAIRVAQRVPALAAAIWHNNKTGQPITRSIIAYDH